MDRAVYQAVADTPTPELDAPVRIPDGVSPAAAMLQAARDAEPRRQSVLEEALANRQATHISPGRSGGIVTSAPLLRPLAADGALVDASEPHHSFVYDL